MNQSGNDLHGPGQHLGHHRYIPVVSGPYRDDVEELMAITTEISLEM